MSYVSPRFMFLVSQQTPIETPYIVVINFRQWLKFLLSLLIAYTKYSSCSMARHPPFLLVARCSGRRSVA